MPTPPTHNHPPHMTTFPMICVAPNELSHTRLTHPQHVRDLSVRHTTLDRFGKRFTAFFSNKPGVFAVALETSVRPVRWPDELSRVGSNRQ